MANEDLAGNNLEKQVDLFIEEQGTKRFAEPQIATIFEKNPTDNLKHSNLHDKMKTPNPYHLLFRRLFEYSHPDTVRSWIGGKHGIEMLVVDESLRWVFSYHAHRHNLFSDDQMMLKQILKRYGDDGHYDGRPFNKNALTQYKSTAYSALNALQNIILKKAVNVPDKAESQIQEGEFYHRYDLGPDVRHLMPASVYASTFKGFEKRLATIPDIDQLKALHLGLIFYRMVKDSDRKKRCAEVIRNPATSPMDAIMYITSMRNIDFHYGTQ